MAKKAKSKKAAGKKVEHKYEATRALRGIINQNVQYGINALEALGDKAGEVVGGAFDTAKNFSENTNTKIENFLKQTQRSYRGSFDSIRKQAQKALGAR